MTAGGEQQQQQQQLFNFVVEIPKGATAKLEVQKELVNNPIAQDTKKGVPRYYTYGVPFFNYGLLPQTWVSNQASNERNERPD